MGELGKSTGRGGFLLAVALACGSCGSGAGSAGQFPISVPDSYVQNILRSEAGVKKVQGEIGEVLHEMLPGDARAAKDCLTSGFVARGAGMAGARRVPDARLDIRIQGPDSEQRMDRAAFMAELAQQTQDWAQISRMTFEFDRFYLDSGGERGTGRVELYLAGELVTGGRADFRLTADVRVESGLDGWRIAQLDWLEGLAIRAEITPFEDISEVAGFSFFESPQNRWMFQAFINEHRVLALGGLSATDWNDDGFVDVIGSLSDGLATLFLNDGKGGFVPQELPVAEPLDCGVVLVAVDLDGDGQVELVNSRSRLYAGETGHFGLYVKQGADWEHRARTFEFKNPVGKRGVSVQTVVPFDANGDGLLDLFFGVYGTEDSRGADYNLVESHDGGRNYLFINQGNLEFREETLERGLSGVQYTYVALPYDFDDDGDVDLFEGNDFGPNILWLNDGEGHFSADQDSILARDSAYTMGVTLADYDDDGRVSMYVVNMSSEAGQRIGHSVAGLSATMRKRVLTIASGNMLYTQGAHGEWTEHAERSACAQGEWGWGAMFFDIDGDGDDEIFATNGFTSHENPTLGDWDSYFWRQVAVDGGLLERGERTYDVNAEYPFQGSYAGYQRDRLFYKADGDDDRFYNAAWHFGLDNLQDGRCVLPIDVDGDGDLDLALWTLQGLRLYRNNAPPGPFARVRLRATKTHPAALGARVSVRVGQTWQHDFVQLVEGFQSQQLLDLQFAWHEAQTIDEIRVEWPSGEEQVFEHLPIGKLLVLEQGSSEVQALSIPRWADSAASLTAMKSAHEQRPPAERPKGTVVSRAASESDTPWPARDALQTRFPEVEFRSAPWDAPPGSTFIHDVQGRLCRAFATDPSSADLERYLIELRDEGPFPELAVLTGRRFLEQDQAEEALKFFRAALEGDPSLSTAAEGLARAQRMLGNMQESERAYELSVQIDPDYALGHFNLAILRLRTGRAALSLASFEETLRIRGEHYETLMAMGEAALVAKQMDLALATFERAADASPDRAEPLIVRAKLLGQQKRYEDARRAFSAALEREADNAAAQRGLERVQALLGG